MKTAWIALGLSVLACAPAPRMGDEIAIVEESAVIVWDAAAHTEHFIRRATFRGSGRDFGFLVPTPAAPLLAEVDDGIFAKLEERTQRETVYETRKKIDFTPLVFLIFYRGEGMPSGAARPVELLSTQKVGGYEAAVLSATDAAALQRWLADHGYAATPDLVEWLDVYVRKQWKITAFKIDASQPSARTSAVKMSFATDRPFFPYREPLSQRRADTFNLNRALNVWFLGSERVIGIVGNATFWPGQLRRSDVLPDALRAEVARIANVALPASTRMTAYLDNARTREGNDDLFFVRAAVQSAFVQPPYVVTTTEKIPLPLDVVAVAAALAALVVWRLTRRA